MARIYRATRAPKVKISRSSTSSAAKRRLKTVEPAILIRTSAVARIRRVTSTSGATKRRLKTAEPRGRYDITQPNSA